MADIASAIKMEEEAFKRMKKQSLRKANSADARKYTGLSGISNPNCDLAPRSKTFSTRKEAKVIPDLMSFQDVAVTDKKENSCTSENDTMSGSTAQNSAYSKSINDVLSLYNTSTSAAPLTGMAANQRQSHYPPLGTFGTSSNYSWQNEGLPNTSISAQGYQTYMPQGDNLLASTNLFSATFQPRTYANSFTSHTTTLQQSHATGILSSDSNDLKSSQSNNNGMKSPFHASSASYGTEASFGGNCHFPRPSSLGQLHDLQFGNRVSTNSPPTVNKTFEQSPSHLNINNEKVPPSAQSSLTRSSSVGSKLQTSQSDAIQIEKLAGIFDDWLKDDWKSNSVTASPQHENFLDKKPAPDWLEWDPLSTSNTQNGLLSPSADDLNKTEDLSTGTASKSPIVSGQDDPDENHEKAMEASVEIDDSTQLRRFAHSLAQLRSCFKCEDPIGNPGHVISPMTDCQQRSGQDACDSGTGVRISVTADGIQEPVTFECNVNASVEHIISQALCITYEDISCVSTHDFCFKVAGRQEYLISSSRLGSYQHVLECRKFERDIRLELLDKTKVDRSLRRTAEDDANENVAEDFLQMLNKPSGVMNRDNIQILLEAYYKETEKLLDAVRQEAEMTSCQQSFERVSQTVKAMCSALGNIELQEISEEIKQLRDLLYKPTAGNSTKSFTSDGSANGVVSSLTKKFDRIRERLEGLTSILLDFSELYCKAYEVDAYFPTHSSPTVGQKMSTIMSSSVRELYSVNVVSLHRIPKLWEATYDEFYVSCSLWHGERQLSHSKSATDYVKMTKNFYPKVYFNKWIEFDVSVCELPLEATLRIYFQGVLRSDDKVTTKKLAWLSVPLFDHQRIMKYQRQILGMWRMSKLCPRSGRPDGPLNSSHDIFTSESTVIQLVFSEDLHQSSVVEHSRNHFTIQNKYVERSPVENLNKTTLKELRATVSRAKLVAGPLFNLSQRERDLLWNHRHIITSLGEDGSPALGLPVLLRCVPHWSPMLVHMQSAYDLIASWPKPLEPEESLALLTSGFPDSRVRFAAINWLEQAGDSEISSRLPQLIQAVRCELHHDSPLTRLLLRRALGSVRICHQLYWLLYDSTWDRMYSDRYIVLHAALVSLCGVAMKKEFEKEKYIVTMINRVAKDVKEAKDSVKAMVLNKGLRNVAKRVDGGKCRIPTNPALVASGLNDENSSYFASNAVPLKLAFANDDASSNAPGDLLIMYKVGDDLRQDALTMQLIRVMDRMWQCEGLDLRMVTFDCLPTGPMKGMVEIVSESKTFREIQSSYGLTGAFKDRPIAEWLQKYNPTGLSYERAIANFTLSCAGYCVATYVLGICDRHNDNIMLRTSGHLFHIDFAKFLGHAQMFGNLKRDRAPFVLTSDMAYVINGGDRPSSKFQDFVDICCLAFNILRKNAHTIINLLSLMVNCDITELHNKSDLKYVYDTLKPNASDTEATTMFTRLIDSSLSSSFTRINFFIHNLAQMRFNGGETEEEKRTLSFSPQIHGYKEDESMITVASVVGYQKRYNPEKHYIYCVKVTRVKKTASIDSYVFRTFDEFEELHRKLSYSTPLQLPSFPNSVVVGRSQVKQVAERRQEKLNTYLKHLLHKSSRAATHDLVYTFFHPILRDEERETNSVVKSPDLTVGGEIRVSLHYKNSALYIMVHHCKNLSPVDGTDPDPYVKTYLHPDPSHSTKRKTKVARKTLHPTYNEMLVYDFTLKEIKTRQLFIGVWNFENFQENDFMGSVTIDLASVDLTLETGKWYYLKQAAL